MELIPKLLTDKSRLQEIYDLRVAVYENSAKSIYINRQIYPNGWSDNLDESENTFHWIIEDDNKIIASARLSVLNNLKDTNEEFDKFELPLERPFAYWSRLVVHHDYRRTRSMMMLDNIRKCYTIDNPQIKFALCCVTEERCKALVRLGFVYLGDLIYNWGTEQNRTEQNRTEQNKSIIPAYLYIQKLDLGYQYYSKLLHLQRIQPFPP